jgi:hypothetical protein
MKKALEPGAVIDPPSPVIAPVEVRASPPDAGD